MSLPRVVVTGWGIVSPVGIGEEKSWQSLIEGRSGIDRITQFDATQFDSQIAGEVKDFDPSFLSLRERKRIPRFVQFALHCTEQAIQNSNLAIERIDPYRIGVIVGAGIGSLRTIEKEYKTFIEKGPSKISPFLIPKLITNEAAGSIAIHFNLKGVNFCTVSACASGAHAIGEAFRYIQQGKVDVVIAGGTESCITPLGVGGFCALKALSTRNDEPQRASRPFDKNRDGFVIGEGAGIVVLEELNFAKKRKADIKAEVIGYGTTCDAYHITAPSPDGEAASYAMELALKEGRVAIGEPLYINAHGTSTSLNDKVETKAIKRTLGSYAKKILVSSTKSTMGHTLGAAGAIEFIVCCLAVRDKIVPPTINYEEPDPECDLNYTPNYAREYDFKVAISNSLGFGGHNVALVVKEFK